MIEGERKIVKFAFQSQFFTHFHHSPFLGGDGCVPCMQMTRGRIIISSFLQYSMELFFSFLHRVFRNNYRRPYTVEPILSLEYLNSIFKKTLFPCMIILFQDLFSLCYILSAHRAWSLFFTRADVFAIFLILCIKKKTVYKMSGMLWNKRLRCDHWCVALLDTGINVCGCCRLHLFVSFHFFRLWYLSVINVSSSVKMHQIKTTCMQNACLSELLLSASLNSRDPLNLPMKTEKNPIK